MKWLWLCVTVIVLMAWYYLGCIMPGTCINNASASYSLVLCPPADEMFFRKATSLMPTRMGSTGKPKPYGYPTTNQKTTNDHSTMQTHMFNQFFYPMDESKPKRLHLVMVQFLFRQVFFGSSEVRLREVNPASHHS